MRSSTDEAEARVTDSIGIVEQGFYERHVKERVGDDPRAEHGEEGADPFGLLLAYTPFGGLAFTRQRQLKDGATRRGEQIAFTLLVGSRADEWVYPSQVALLDLCQAQGSCRAIYSEYRLSFLLNISLREFRRFR